MFQFAQRVGVAIQARPALLVRGSQPAWGFRAAATMRDPERPVRPISPYLRFLADFRNRESTKTMKPKDLMKAAGTEWKGLPESTKQPYEKPYEQELAKYREAFEKYEKSGKLAAWKRDPEKPKKPLTGYMRYAAEVRPQLQHMKVTEQVKEIAAKWKALTPAQKEPYEKAAAAEGEKYKADLKAYKDSGKEAAWKKKKGIDKLEEKKMKAALKESEKKAKAKAKEADKKAKAKATAAYNQAKMKLKRMTDRRRKVEKQAKELVKKAVTKETEAKKQLKEAEKAKGSPKLPAKAPQAKGKGKAKAAPKK